MQNSLLQWILQNGRPQRLSKSKMGDESWLQTRTDRTIQMINSVVDGMAMIPREVSKATPRREFGKKEEGKYVQNHTQ